MRSVRCSDTSCGVSNVTALLSAAGVPNSRSMTSLPPRTQSYLPDTISTDLHKGSLSIQQSDMPNVMSKMMLLGMSFSEALVRSTVNPAKEIGRYPELGTLGIGQVADIAVFAERTGVFAFKDS